MTRLRKKPSFVQYGSLPKAAEINEKLLQQALDEALHGKLQFKST